MTTMNQVFNRILVMSIIGIVGGSTLAYWQTHPTDKELRLEYTAYRHCMQQASTCHMDVEDFIRYYQLKEELEL